MESRPQGNYDDMFGDMLKSAGIDTFEAGVITALNEFASRFAADILHDAKDYSSHAKKEQIDERDVEVALELCDTYLMGNDPNRRLISEIHNEINSRDLLSTLDTTNVLIKYPRRPQDAFLQRPFTYVPGCEAYPELPKPKCT